MLVTSLCTPIILNACRYFHKRLNIRSHILYDSYHMSPLIQAALSVRALNRSMGLNLFKCASFSTLTPLTFAFFFTPAQRRVLVRRGVELEDLHRPGSWTQWKSWICAGDWTSWALPWKTSGWRCWMGERVWKDGGRRGKVVEEGGRER